MNKQVTRLTKILALGIILFSCHSFTEEEQASFDRGKELYISQCISCHGPGGDGLKGAYPSLLKPEILQVHNQRAVSLIKKGSNFEGGMKPIALSDEEIADILNYINNSWDNEASFLNEEAIQNL